MGIAKVCKCGHTKTDHRNNSKDKRKKCDWYNCDCKEFIEDHLEQRPAIINYDEDMSSNKKKTQPYKKILTMNDLDKDGRPFFSKRL